jgi:hypothetical protein
MTYLHNQQDAIRSPDRRIAVPTVSMISAGYLALAGQLPTSLFVRGSYLAW